MELDIRELQRSVARVVADKKAPDTVIREICAQVLQSSSVPLLLCKIVPDSVVQQDFFGALMRLQASDLRRVLNSDPPTFLPTPTWKLSLIVLGNVKEISHMRKIVVRVACESNIPSLLLKLVDVVSETSEAVYQLLNDLLTYKEVYKDLVSTSSLQHIAKALTIPRTSDVVRAECEACIRTLVEHHKKEPQTMSALTGSVVPSIASRTSMATPNAAADILCLVLYLAQSAGSAEILTALSLASYTQELVGAIKDFPLVDDNQAVTIFSRLQLMATLPEIPSATSGSAGDTKGGGQGSAGRSSWSAMSMFTKVVSVGKAVAQAASGGTLVMPTAGSGVLASHPEYLECMCKIVLVRTEPMVQRIGVRHIRDLLLSHAQNYGTLNGKTHIVGLLRGMKLLEPPSQHVVIHLLDELALKHNVGLTEEVMALLAGLHQSLSASTAIVAFGVLTKLMQDTTLVSVVLDSGVFGVLHHYLATVQTVNGSLVSSLYQCDSPSEAQQVQDSAQQLILSIVMMKHGLAALLADTFVPTAIGMVGSTTGNKAAQDIVHTLVPYCTNFVTYSIVEHIKASTTVASILELLVMITNNKKLVLSFLQHDGVSALLLGPLQSPERTDSKSSCILAVLLTRMSLASPQNEGIALALADKITWTPQLLLDCVSGTTVRQSYLEARVGEGSTWTTSHIRSGYDSMCLPALMNEVCIESLYHDSDDVMGLVTLLTRVPCVTEKMKALHDFLVSKLLSSHPNKSCLRTLAFATACGSKTTSDFIPLLCKYPETLLEYFETLYRDESSTEGSMIPHVVVFPQSSFTIRGITFTDATAWPPASGYSWSIWVRHHVKLETFVDGSPAVPLSRMQWIESTAEGDQPNYVQFSLVPGGSISVSLNLATATSVMTSATLREVKFPSCVLLPGCWYNLVLVHSKVRVFSGEMSLYQNGALAATHSEAYPFAFPVSNTLSSATLSVMFSTSADVLHFGPISIFEEALTASQVEGVYIPIQNHHRKRPATLQKTMKMKVFTSTVKKWLYNENFMSVCGGNMTIPLFPSSCVFYVNPSSMTNLTSFSETTGKSKISPAYVEGYHAAPWYGHGANIFTPIRSNRRVVKALFAAISAKPKLLVYVLGLLDKDDEEDPLFYQDLCNAVLPVATTVLPELLASAEFEIRPGKFIVSNLYVVEYILLNTLLWNALTDEAIIKMMKHMVSKWLIQTDQQGVFNAQRLGLTHFLHRLLYNLCCRGTGITVTIHVLECIKIYYLCAGLSTPDTQTLCVGINHLSRPGSVLGCVGLSVAFRETLLNLLLRIMCDVAGTHSVPFSTSFTKACGPNWILKLIEPTAHSVTRTLALQIFANVLTLNQHFQYAVEKANTLKAMRSILENPATFVDSNMYSILIHLAFGERLRLIDFDEDHSMLQTRNLMRSAPPVLVCFPTLVTIVCSVMNAHFYESRSSQYVKYFKALPSASSRAGKYWKNAGTFVRGVVRFCKGSKSFRWVTNSAPPTPNLSTLVDNSITKPSAVSLIVQVIHKIFLEHGSSNFVSHLYNPLCTNNPIDWMGCMAFNTLPLDLSVDPGPATPSMLVTPGEITDAAPDSSVGEVAEATEELAATGLVIDPTVPVEEIAEFATEFATSPRDSMRIRAFSQDTAPVAGEDPSVGQTRDTLLEMLGTQLPLTMLCNRDAGGNFSASMNPGKFRYLSCALCLHHLLFTFPRTAKISQALFYANSLCLSWMKAIERKVTVRSLLEDSASRNIAANALSVCEYLVDRLFAGGVTPIPELLKTLSHVCARFQEANLGDNMKAIRAAAQRCILLILSQHFNKKDTTFLVPILQTLVNIAPNVMAAKSCSVEFLRLFACRIFYLLDVIELRNYALVLLRTVLRTIREVGCQEKLFIRQSQTGSGRIDVFRGGLELLFFADSNVQFLRWYDAQKEVPGENVFTFFSYTRTKYVIPQQHEEIRHGKVFLFEAQRMRDKFNKDQEGQIRDAMRLWEIEKENVRVCGPGSWVDPRLVDSPDVEAMLKRVGGETLDDLNPDESPTRRTEIGSSSFLLKSVMNTSADKYLHLDDPYTHLSTYIPTSGIGFCSNLSVLNNDGSDLYSLVKCSSSVNPLTAGARYILTLLVGENTKVLAVANIYKVATIITIPSLLIVTTHELIVVAHGRVTATGDIIITNDASAFDEESPENQELTTRRRAPSTVQMNRWVMQTIGLSSRQRSTRNRSSTITRDHSKALRQQITTAVATYDGYVWRYPATAIRTLTYRSLHHNPAALEITLLGSQGIMFAILDRSFTLSEGERENVVQAMMQTSQSEHIKVKTGKSMIADLRGASKQWMACEMSTYDYLLQINDAAGRTFLDYNQYPVFPWVVANYTGTSLGLSEEATFRDFTKPMGAQDAVRAAEFRQRYEEWPDPSTPRFHYGSHYSSSAIVLYYKVRIQPNTSLSIAYQGGRLDVADRLFHSVAEAWYSSSRGSRTDVKELIPEFYDPQNAGGIGMLKNLNKVSLGVNRDGVELNDAVLPPWAREDPMAFVMGLREALECDLVSAHIHSWIDLVFGVCQRGQEAEKALNVFHPLTYEDGMEKALQSPEASEDLKAIVTHLENFGITPKSVFDAPHPRRNIRVGPSTTLILLNHARDLMCRTVEGGTSPHAVMSLYFMQNEMGNLVASAQWRMRCVVGNSLITYHWLPNHRCLRSPLDGLVFQTDDVISCIRSSPCGSLIVLGTSLGGIMTIVRGIGGKYNLVSSVQGAHMDAINNLVLDDKAGILLSMCGKVCCVWRVTATYCHHVFRVRHDPEESITCAAVVSSVFILIGSAHKISLYSTLSSMDQSPTSEFTEPIATAAIEVAPLSAIGVVQTSDWSPMYVIVTGHRDGCISFWELTLHSPIALRSHVSITSAPAAVTTLCCSAGAYDLFVGYDNGTIMQLSLTGVDAYSATRDSRMSFNSVQTPVVNNLSLSSAPSSSLSEYLTS